MAAVALLGARSAYGCGMFANWDLERLFALLWRQRVAMATAVAISLIFGIIYMHSVKPAYTVSIQLVPAPASQSSNSGNGLGALASGLLGGSSDPTSFKIYTAALQSHAASEMIAGNASIMRRMFSDQWSERDHGWKPHYGMLHSVSVAVKSLLGIHLDDWAPPSADDIYAFLQKDVDVMSSRDSPVVTVSIQSKDPKLAAGFLTILTSDVDMLTRRRALDRANSYIDYLGRELNHVTVTEYRTALVNHLSDEEKTRMMASATNVGYSADVFSGPMTSQRPTSPKFVTTMVAALLLGSILGFFIALFYDLRNRVFTLPLFWLRGEGRQLAGRTGR